MLIYTTLRLGVAQFGSVLEWGSRGRRFESSHPDHEKALENVVFSRAFSCSLFFYNTLPHRRATFPFRRRKQNVGPARRRGVRSVILVPPTLMAALMAA